MAEPNEGVLWMPGEPPRAVTFHRRGHHSQKAHGRRVSLATDDRSHTQGGMIALMPSAADARRLAFKGGEPAAELHCTLFYLGDDGSLWTEDQRGELEGRVRSLVAGLPPVSARVFGVAHWNGDGDKPSWVWSVGDDPESGAHLGEARVVVGTALTMTPDLPEIPEQHSPWVAHICAAYDGDLTLVRELEKRLGPVKFDRIRLSFGDDDRDIPLEGGAEALTASGLRREPLPHELGCDFAEHNRQWEGAVQTASNRMISVYAAWRTWIAEQIKAGADTPEELAGISLGPEQGVDQAAEVLAEAMTDLARRAGQSLQREAERQGVEVPEWALPEDTVTAAVGGRRLLDSVARMTADLMATSVVQTAKRVVTGLFTRDAPAEQIAAEVDRALADAQDSMIRSQVGTAMSTAQTAGRQAVLEAAPPGEYYASELLDKNTCAPCRAVDGEQFGSLEIAIKAYPVMGYKDCVGPRYGNSCRGMIVARWASETDGGEAVTAAGTAFHGTLGDPGYSKLHPGGKGKRQENGVWLGSSRYSEEEQMDAFYSYTGGGFADMNNWLRSGEHSGVSDVEGETHALNDLIRIQEPLEKVKVLYRGIANFPEELRKGDVFHDKGFVSTTDNAAISRDHFSGPKGGDGVLFAIHAPAGTKVLDAMKIGGYEEDSEFILPPGTKFRVKSVTVSKAEAKKYGMRTSYTLEVVLDD